MIRRILKTCVCKTGNGESICLPELANKLACRGLVIIAIIMMSVKPGWAVQAHGGAEGLVSHQIAHILFTIGMGYLLYRLSAMRKGGTGWFEFKLFLWLLLAWNVTTFSGHWINEIIPADKFIRTESGSLTYTIESFLDTIYYLTRLDHLILVPSFAFLLLALRKWRAQQ